MLIIDFSKPLAIIVGVTLYVLVLMLGKETKKSQITATMLFAFLAILVGHCVRFFTYKGGNDELYQALQTSLVIDFVFIFLTFIAYLWIDDIQAKKEDKKSIDNCLDWFWSKV